MEVKVYNQKGEEIGQVLLPKEIFEREINPDLIWQVVYCMMANQRKSSAHTKTRAEVRGGGRKPWPQKGTGRARHGSIRSPIWVGGGVAHGPRKEKKYKKRIPKKMKRQALFSVLSGKLKDNELIVLDKIELEKPKTKLMAEIIKNLREKLLDKGKILLALPQKDEIIERSARNLSDVETIEARNLNVLDLLNHKYLILLKDSVKAIKDTFLK
ncbi:MAG: 50S ribosomal protein L4 [Candidatus Pacebacteria bacterium]|nr:50S ribosomal protein L4 [Candidatus Paceibacterota bacterium]